ncbi:SDR family NAD(P)-dependent oxidoreductase [Granulosicoccus antarcticus]|uniref:2,5-dichloro-2,5-cyclohexadiene-1,4-diol dehydrogenase n=1 Tax=Granulosicoccus antarcticus IMCC3135 TaxID=1192854 RepID=A0A2Z2NM98_9GAMM|nr:SDR family oxidoreductase [Granulosicoccus antarcticus]ASJ70908.1 2,5-dichloro-2,5-cyclohexadiene-1,4-diol dehydrogenase [Granulosicoccus antarcticus IMCC3135]
MNKELENRLVIVTGGGAGIGRGIAEACHDAGARVVVGTLEGKLDYPGRDAIDCRQLDVADASSITSWVDAVIATHGPIDALVNNAGVTITDSFLSMSVEKLETLWSVNQRSVFLMTQAVARTMSENGHSGSIVNIASNHAGATTAGYEMYAGTKAAIVAMTRAMAWSLGKHGIRVNSLSPGLTRTETIAAGPANEPETEAMFRTWHATGRYNSVAEVAKCAVFLLSDASTALSGSDMLADQGMSALLCAEL